ncbi:RNA 3'-terminal phosphate cyclase [Candidatus Woesearchaeota archaeon]|nr:RNA 3'-terminal phosphate cyclase [Candidatus Woesearchaeota archaeon]
MLTIDGSYLEGGGQIVRTAVGMSALLGEPVKIINIRRNRPNPGLKAQHLHAVKALQELCDADVVGCKEGSDEIIFAPKQLKAKTLNIDIGTAGSIGLVLQAILLPCCFLDKSITIRLKGGTHGKWAMPIEYIQNVLVPHIQRFCEKISINQEKRGYYPAGGGKVEVKIKPLIHREEYSKEDFLKKIEELKPIQLLNQGKLLFIKGISHASASLAEREVAERQLKSAKNILKEFNVPVNISVEYSDAISKGSGIALWAVFENKYGEVDQFNPVILGCDALGEKNISAESVAGIAAKELYKEIKQNACVDRHLADNLIPWMGLLSGSAFKTSLITDHTKTNIFSVENFFGKMFKINENVVRRI